MRLRGSVRRIIYDTFYLLYWHKRTNIDGHALARLGAPHYLPHVHHALIALLVQSTNIDAHAPARLGAPDYLRHVHQA